MQPSYENAVYLLATIEEKNEELCSALAREHADKEALLNTINQEKDYISQVCDAIGTLKDDAFEILSVAETKQYIKDHSVTISKSQSVEEYLRLSEKTALICQSARVNAEALRYEQQQADIQIQRIKRHPKYKNWVQNADKLHYTLLPNSMPLTLEEYSDEAIELLIDYGTKVLWGPYKRYMCFHLYSLYKMLLRDSDARNKTIQNFEDTCELISQLSLQWISALSCERQKHQEKLAQLEQQYAEFDDSADARMWQAVDQAEAGILELFDEKEWNDYSFQAHMHTKDWPGITHKDDIRTDEVESFSIATYTNRIKPALSTNPYIAGFAERLHKHFLYNLLPVEDTLFLSFPLVMHLDTLQFRMSVDTTQCEEHNITEMNGTIQGLVASLIANLPVGKAKFIFGDPANTGVFSNFMHIGKNDAEGSRLSTYIVSTKDITNELERLSNQIAYTVNNILKGTRTTLFQHNRERSFNSAPYEFLFLMDYPQNLTAQSLQALKNIVENGPKCGIFTFIFKTGDTAMELLRSEEQMLARNIAQFEFDFFYGTMTDKYGSTITTSSIQELDTRQFDAFVDIYNAAIKDSQQLTVKLDELDGSVSERGEFKIPIGKNLGGETEYMSFFGSCQNYLMTGAPRIGKTNALHVMVYNTLKYVPDAELYLVDFKQGVEFAPYARLNHPVIKALAVESVPEFGYAVLKHTEDKIKAISELFISHSVSNWKEYYHKTGKILPVTIVLLDEFQHLFDTEVGKDCTRILELIVREGGAFNVHVILATQSINSISGLTPSAKENIFGRMVFYHSEPEYKSMLWDDTHLALTLKNDIKGQMVFATGDKSTQRMLQWAIAKPVPDVIAELGRPLDEGRYPTKLLLSTVRENPFSVFNTIIDGKYQIVDADSCEITLGNKVDLFSGSLRRQLESGKPEIDMDCMEHSYLKLVKKPNENMLLVGSDENLIEGSFQLALYCALARQIALGRKHSILLLTSEFSDRLTDIAKAFPKYIDCYGQEDSLADIDLGGKEFMFVFGLHHFRSLSYQPDQQYNAARADGPRMRTPGTMMMHAIPTVSARTDGQLMQMAVESGDIHVIAWHNNMQQLCEMYGGLSKIQDFLSKFIHKVGYAIPDKKEARMFMNSDRCAQLSHQAAVYQKMNKEHIIRPYKALDSSYCADLNQALHNMEGVAQK